MEQIACKECTSPDCHGCNMYRLERMLMSGKLDTLMDEKRTIKMDADVRHVVLCRDCIFRSNEWTGCPKLNGTITYDEFFCKCGIRGRKADGLL